MRRIAILLCLVPLSARADDLARATAYFKQMQYRQAWKAAAKVERSASSGPEQLVESYRIQGLSQAALGKVKAASRAFRKLLAIQPGFRLSDDISPKLMPPFDQAVVAAGKQKPIRLEHAPPGPGESLGGIELRAMLTSNPMKMIKSVELRFRLDDGKEEKMVFAIRGARAKTITARLPPNLRAKKIAYYFAAVNPWGAAAVLDGSADKPHVLEVASAEEAVPVAAMVGDPGEGTGLLDPPPPPPPGATEAPTREDERDERTDTPWYKTWWFWTAVGAVVVAGTTTGVVLGLQDGESGGPYHYDIRIR